MGDSPEDDLPLPPIDSAAIKHTNASAKIQMWRLFIW
jgi:hypothetical protein